MEDTWPHWGSHHHPNQLQNNKSHSSSFSSDAELLPLAACLTILVTLTILFEISFHNFKHYVASWKTTGRRATLIVIEKVTSELTVLGFISAMVLVTANGLAGAPFVSAYLPELEVAHLWLFFVAMCYVLESLILLHVKNKASMHYTKGTAFCCCGVCV